MFVYREESIPERMLNKTLNETNLFVTRLHFEFRNKKTLAEIENKLKEQLNARKRAAHLKFVACPIKPSRIKQQCDVEVKTLAVLGENFQTCFRAVAINYPIMRIQIRHTR